MGGKSSKRSAPGRYQQSSYPQPTQTYESARRPQSYGGWGPDSKKGPGQKFVKIDDNFNNLEHVKFRFLSNY